MTTDPDQRFACEELFQQAVALHEQGRLDQAEHLYRVRLKADPADIGTLHNLGILCIQQGKYDDAAKLAREGFAPQTRLGQPDGISPSRMAEMLEVDKAGPIGGAKL